MNNIDLTILTKKPELTEKIMVEIDPLAPLSMVSDLPGSFYKSLKSPSKKMLCGLFENLLGWHIDIADRIIIQKELIKTRKKQGINYTKPQHGSTYIPLLMEYFEIEVERLPPMIHYNDLWSKAYQRKDADVHPKGTANISYELIPEKRKLRRDEKKPRQIANDELLNLYLNNIGCFPMFYSTPIQREYISTKETFEICIALDQGLFTLIQSASSVNGICYLGNSEGWVDLKIMKL